MGDILMPYKYLHKGNQYGLKNIKTGQVIWYDPDKVASMERLKDMARLREAFSHGFVPKRKFTIVRKHPRSGTYGVTRHSRRLR
jgi:hypothetical protein